MPGNGENDVICYCNAVMSCDAMSNMMMLCGYSIVSPVVL